MKMIRIIFLLFAGILVHGKLSEEENQQREDTCGVKKDQYIWAFTNDKGEGLTAAVPISQKHFLTYARPVLSLDSKWIHDQSNFTWQCTDENTVVEMPPDMLSHIKLAPLGSLKDPNYESPKPVRAYFIAICNKNINGTLEWHYAPMIVEVEDSLKVDYPCITDDYIHSGDTLYTYRLHDSATVTEHTVKMEKAYNDAFSTTMFEKDKLTDVGGPVLQPFGDTWTLVGMKGGYSYDGGNSNRRYFHAIEPFLKQLCELAGICGTDVSPAVVERSNANLVKKESKNSGKSAKSGESKKEEEEAGNGAKMIGIEMILVIVFVYLWK
uniref:Peptidase S1 domain-containing protein n=1 Tax=Caenorhabditis tropicalis TaxID=1561998 RepID=A0A1I7UNZ7_9PELO